VVEHAAQSASSRIERLYCQNKPLVRTRLVFSYPLEAIGRNGARAASSASRAAPYTRREHQHAWYAEPKLRSSQLCHAVEGLGHPSKPDDHHRRHTPTSRAARREIPSCGQQLCCGDQAAKLCRSRKMRLANQPSPVQYDAERSPDSAVRRMTAQEFASPEMSVWRWSGYSDALNKQKSKWRSVEPAGSRTWLLYSRRCSRIDQLKHPQAEVGCRRPGWMASLVWTHVCAC